MPQRIRLGLCILVGVVWTASFTASLINPDYKPDPSINAAFTLVIGAALTRVGKKDASGDDE